MSVSGAGAGKETTTNARTKSDRRAEQLSKMRPFIAETNSIQPESVSQLASCNAVLVAITCILLFGGAGCDSVYYRAQTGFSAQPTDRLKMRIEDAYQAERRATEAARLLRDRIVNGGDSGRVKTDVDRLELCALDLQRCVEAVQDAAAVSENPQQFSADIQRLKECSSQFLKKTLIVHDSGVSPTVQQIEELLNVLSSS